MAWGSLKKLFVSAGIIAGLGVATPTNLQAADLEFGLKIGGPNSGFYVEKTGDYYDHYDYKGYKRNRYDRHYDRYDYKHSRRPYVGEYGNCGGITRMAPVRHGRYCEHPTAIHDRLRYEGWHDFKGLRVRPRAFRVFARNANGEPYKLRIDRCTGEILRAKRKLAPYYRAHHYY